MTDYTDEQIELMVARLGTDEYNQGAPRCAPWRTSLSCSGPDRWIVYQPTGSDQSRIITEGARQPFADFIAAARELVPSLLARAQQAEAERDDALGKVSAIDGGFDVYRRQTQRMESRLRAELAEAKAEAVELRRQLLDETYRPEGGEIVMRELVEAKAEAVERLRQFNAAKDQRDAALAEADRLRAELADAKAENADRAANEKVIGEVLRRLADKWRREALGKRAAIAVLSLERDRLAAQVAAVRALCDEAERDPDSTVVTHEEFLNGELVAAPTLAIAVSELRAALDGTEQDGESR